MSYNNFAYIYDTLMNNIDYDKWVDYLEDIFAKHDTVPKLILELACGTGNISTRLAKRRYELIGLDKSIDMLSVAQNKCFADNLDILFINQDMCDFELYGTVDCVICMMDAVNYILDSKLLSTMFNLVYNYLNYEGLFIFDMRSEYALSEVIGNNTFVEDSEDITYIWQNEYNSKKRISQMDLTFFVKDGLFYEKFNEIHKLKSYTIEEMSQILHNSRLQNLGIFNDLSFNAPRKNSQRIFFVSKKPSFV